MQHYIINKMLNVYNYNIIILSFCQVQLLSILLSKILILEKRTSIVLYLLTTYRPKPKWWLYTVGTKRDNM